MARTESFIAVLALAAHLSSGSATLSETLHDPARSGDTATIGELIAAGADLDAQDKRGDTPLITAAYSGESEAVAALLDGGARIDGRSDRGMTALHAAAYRGHADIATLLIARGADVDDQANKFRISPLHAAAEEGHLDVVRVLIEAGADLDVREVNAITALTRAGWKERWDVFTALRTAGAGCQPKNVTGEDLYTRCMSIEP